MTVSVFCDQIHLQLFPGHALDFGYDLVQQTIKFVRHLAVVPRDIVTEHAQRLLVELVHRLLLLQFAGLESSQI